MQLVAIFGLLLSQGVLEMVGIPTLATRTAAELAILALFLKAPLSSVERGERLRLIGVVPVAGLVGVIIVSYLFNRPDPLTAVLFSRHLLVFYLLLIATLNLKLDANGHRKVQGFLVFMIALQLPAALVKFALVGVREGGGIGTMSLQAGSLSTIMPLAVVAFLLAGYCWTGRARYLIGIPLCLLFGILGEKRAVAFFFPVVLIFVAVTWMSDTRARRRLLPVTGTPRATFLVAFIAVLSLGGLFTAARTLDSLSIPTGVSGLRDTMGHLITVGLAYETAVVAAGAMYDDRTEGFDIEVTTGRISSTIRSFGQLRAEGTAQLLLGRGPGTLMESRLTSTSLRESYMRLGIRAGSTGIVWVVNQVGVLGVLAFLSLYATITHATWRRYVAAQSVRDKVFGLGLLGVAFVVVLDFFVYSSVAIVTGTLLPVWFFLTASYLVDGNNRTLVEPEPTGPMPVAALKP
ncbi:MAG: hypothetical protein VX815_16315 [Gemmatimonadota bacterium]|nr:hypothetical protein [Gemmatimonadota bacterium]